MDDESQKMALKTLALLIINFPADLTFLINHKRTSRGDNSFLKLMRRDGGNFRPIFL